MLEKLKEEVFRANLELVRNGLVIHTWGNVSGKDPESGNIVIKPSGVKYDTMKAGDMVVLDPQGNVLEGEYRPSTDAPTHIYLYKQFSSVGGIVHTHSTYATSWAQAGRPIPPFGTTHADHFYGDVPCSRLLTEEEISVGYELNTGKVIAEAFEKTDPMAVPSVLVHSHGPFSWGADADDAVYNAVTLEEIAKMAYLTVMLGNTSPIDQYLLDKHYLRKHGRNAYYGQKKKQ
ncbi:MAG TPA: L-ribulose-5-phosphate 4-epimerase [Bacteroidales bacterium]|nr:L-ribulose-5-phosphate 4-epimerase [Bacteroidales bacterium]HPI67655.1 L-ribulose-5-phosphate 4-epimerase [Bacteroidales bacterium]HPR72040.1 L-ribulose-5-phosphate 4-epimerase [Bacteroidales bacterium]